MRRIFLITIFLLKGICGFAQANVIHTHIACSIADSIGIAVFIHYPDSARFDTCGAPVAIIIPGGRMPIGIYPTYPALLPKYGVIEVFLNFPGATNQGNFNSGGHYDLRGPNCIEALKSVAQFCMGLDTTISGDYLGDLIPVTVDYDNVGFMGGSNGGNISIVTEGMYAQDLPGLKWITNWESPVGDGTLLADMGNVNTGFNSTQNISYNDTTGAFDFSKLRYCDTLYTHHEYSLLDTMAGFYFDNNSNGLPGDSVDFPLEPLMYDTGVAKRSYYSHCVLQHGYAMGIIPVIKPYYIPSIQESMSFWKYRNGINWIDSVITKNPDLMFIASGRNHDHYIHTPDHPGILNQYQKFVTGGQHFVRINPDKSYLEYVLDSVYPGLPDNTCFTSYDHLSIRNVMVPDSVDQKDLYTASILELVDRAQRHDYRLQLDSVYATCDLYIDTTHYYDNDPADSYQIADSSQTYNLIHSPARKNEIKLFPNPSSDVAVITLPASEKIRVEISDLTGRIIFSERTFIQGNQFTIQTKYFGEGLYLVKLTSESFTKIIKLEIVH